MNNRLEKIKTFYRILDRQEHKIGGRRLLRDCIGRLDWPSKGVYFFMEEGENRTDSGKGLRIVRVGTHAVTRNAKSTLWQRLSQHRGPLKSGGGSHRGSIFRILVGMALIEKDNLKMLEWGIGKKATKDILDSEHQLEQKVSQVIRNMPFIWLEIDDEPGKNSKRKFIERNSIALLSNCWETNKIDPASHTWLGNYCAPEFVRLSGMWNQHHVIEKCHPDFLEELDKLVK